MACRVTVKEDSCERVTVTQQKTGLQNQRESWFCATPPWKQEHRGSRYSATISESSPSLKPCVFTFFIYSFCFSNPQTRTVSHQQRQGGSVSGLLAAGHRKGVSARERVVCVPTTMATRDERLRKLIKGVKAAVTRQFFRFIFTPHGHVETVTLRCQNCTMGNIAGPPPAGEMRKN